MGGRRRRGPRGHGRSSPVDRNMLLGRTACTATEPDHNAHALERTLRPFSPIYDREFLEACEPLYSVHMGVETPRPSSIL